ncbi:NfeD family protein [Bacillus tuaregi]|uniref:NfeD family protein n=1 Tax=Bacillus tuaregi TaxID=1816695 RepID=UPI0008F7FBD0|nr:NfeD family protein [Bacillus tuaregi]
MLSRHVGLLWGLSAFILLSIPAGVSASMMKGDGQINGGILEQLAFFTTEPIVITILLTIGFLGFVVELFTPRIGLPGIVGILAFLLFFYGHIVIGSAGITAVILFATGIILILLELVLPGGIIGIFGFGAFLASFFLAGNNFVQMGISLLIAFSISILACVVMIKVYDKKMKFFKKLILTDSTSTEQGYVSNQNRTELVGVVGTCLTDLRPSGMVVIGEERIDVVSEGEFIAKGSQVKVVKTEGSRIVVREIVNKDRE